MKIKQRLSVHLNVGCIKVQVQSCWKYQTDVNSMASVSRVCVFGDAIIAVVKMNLS